MLPSYNMKSPSVCECLFLCMSHAYVWIQLMHFYSDGCQFLSHIINLYHKFGFTQVPDLHVGNLSNIRTTCPTYVYVNGHRSYVQEMWMTDHQSCTIPVTRNGTGFMIFPAPVYWYRKLRPIYTTSRHVMATILRSTGAKHFWEI